MHGKKLENVQMTGKSPWDYLCFELILSQTLQDRTRQNGFKWVLGQEESVSN